MLSSNRADNDSLVDTHPSGILDSARDLIGRLTIRFRLQADTDSVGIDNVTPQNVADNTNDIIPAKTEKELIAEANAKLKAEIEAHNAPIKAKISMYQDLFKRWLNTPKDDMLQQGIVERKLDVIILFLQSDEARELHQLHTKTSDGKISKTTALEDLFNSEIAFVENCTDVKESKIMKQPTKTFSVGQKLFPLLCKMVNGQKPPMTHETSKTFNQDDVRALILEMMKLEGLNTNIAQFEAYKNTNYAPFHYIAASGDLELIQHFLDDTRIEIDYLDRPQWVHTRDAIRTFLSPDLGKQIESVIHAETTRRLKVKGHEHKISPDGFEDLLRAQAAARAGSRPASFDHQ